MKGKMLFTILASCMLVLSAGSFSRAATIDHSEISAVKHDCFSVADLTDYVVAPAPIVIGLATLEAPADITPVYPYAGEVKAYATSSSHRSSSLFRMARDGLSRG